MQIYKETTRVHTYQHVVGLTCDLCGRTVETDRCSWAAEEHKVSEVEVHFKSGENTDDSGKGEKITVDICPDCFMRKLIPWVTDQGGTPTTTTWEW